MLAGSLVGCTSEESVSSVIYPERAKVMDFLNSVYNAYPVPGMTVGIVTADTSIFYTMGLANAEDHRPLTDSTVFFSGSFSELMVATATLILQERGELNLQDPVKRRLSYFDLQGPAGEVRIHHLLSHTSGIPHFNPAWDMPSYDADALETTTRSIVYQELEFVPGTRCKRSPYNFDILADLLAKTRQSPFEMIMRETVFEPLNMASTRFGIEEISSHDLASPHHVADWLNYDMSVSEIYPYTRENTGSFGLHTTAGDFAQWMKVLLRHKDVKPILSEQSIDRLLQLHYQTEANSYKGYGWEIFKADGKLVYTNSWSKGGFSGDLSLYPDEQIGIVVFANTADDFNPKIISDQLVHYLLGGKLESIKVPAHLVMSRQLAKGKTVDEVLNWYDCQVGADPDYLLSPLLLGQLGVNLLHRLERPEEALKVFRYAAEIYPESPEAHLNLAEGLLIMGRTDEAERHFGLALTLKENLNSPYVNFLKEQLDIARENNSSS